MPYPVCCRTDPVNNFNIQGPENGETIHYLSGNTCIMDRLFSIVPTGLYTLTATVSNVPHVFTTAVPGTFPPQASNFFVATFNDVTVGTVNTRVTFVSLLKASLISVYYLCFDHCHWRGNFNCFELLVRRNVALHCPLLT